MVVVDVVVGKYEFLSKCFLYGSITDYVEWDVISPSPYFYTNKESSDIVKKSIMTGMTR